MHMSLPRAWFLVATILAAVHPIPVSAQTVSDPAWGFSFPLPAGWKVQKGEDGALLGHDTIAGLIIVFSHSAASLAEMREEMLEGIVEEGIELRIAGQLEQVGKNALGGACEGVLDGQEVKGRTCGAVSPSGGGAYVIAVATPQKYGTGLASAADQIVKGMQFPKVDTELARALAGTWVTVSSNTETKVVLAADGQFSLYSESSYGGSFSDSGGGDAGGWGAAGSGESRGRWTVRGTRQKGVITLVYENGDRADIPFGVHVENGETYWNEYWFDGVLYGRSR